MINQFWSFILIPIILALGLISILFYIGVVLIPFYIILYISRINLLNKFIKVKLEAKSQKEIESEDFTFGVFIFSIPFIIYFGIYLYDNFDFKWKTFSDFIFNLLDFIF